MVALNADLELVGPNGTRILPISEWYLGPGKTVRDRCEVLLNILFIKKIMKIL